MENTEKEEFGSFIIFDEVDDWTYTFFSTALMPFSMFLFSYNTSIVLLLGERELWTFLVFLSNWWELGGGGGVVLGGIASERTGRDRGRLGISKTWENLDPFPDINYTDPIVLINNYKVRFK